MNAAQMCRDTDTLGPWGHWGTPRDPWGHSGTLGASMLSRLPHCLLGSSTACVFWTSWCATRWKEWGDTDQAELGSHTPKSASKKSPTRILRSRTIVGESLGVTSKYCVWSLASRERIYMTNKDKNKHSQRAKGRSIFFFEEEII